MVLVFHLICLTIALSTTMGYILSNHYSRSHRLLPLVMGLVCLYNFYESINCLIGANEIFYILERLLMVQIVMLLFCYSIDYMHLKIDKASMIFLFFIMLACDASYFLFQDIPHLFDTVYRYTIYFFVAVLIYLLGRSIRRYSYSRREIINIVVMSISVLIPATVIVVLNFLNMQYNLYLNIALAISMLLILYMAVSGRLQDTYTVLHEQYFLEVDCPVLLVDEGYHLVDANEQFFHVFPQVKKVDWYGKQQDKALNLHQLITDLVAQPEFYHEDRYYKVEIHQASERKQERGYIVQFQDITEQKHETQMMAQMKEIAEQQTVMKSQFLARMSHDLRSPLHAIIGVSDLLSHEKQIPSRNLKMINHVKSSGRNLLEIVNSILDYSKLEAGKLELMKKPYSLEHMLEELTEMSIVNLAEKPVEFSIDIETDYPAEMVGDEFRVREMIQNILSNAVKFTQEGEIRGRISVLEENGRYFCRCTVKDTGCGMNREQIDKLFSEYVTFAEGKNLEGTGLGMSILSQLSELMDGKAWAESDGEHGSEIGVVFYQDICPTQMRPKMTMDRRYLDQRIQPAYGEIIPTWIFPEAQVLCAEDMKVNQKLLQGIVSPWQFHMDFADNGRQAVGMAKIKNYDLIFMDLMMPEMNGAEAAEIISATSDVPIVMLSANLFEDTKKEYEGKGFSEFISKPVDPIQLKKTIESYLPEDKREAPPFIENNRSLESKATKSYIRTLKTYINEMTPMEAELTGLYERDPELFRIKVHGIKGASKQLGRKQAGYWGEVMEMAAKTDNRMFIQEHLETLLTELDYAVEEARAELKHLESEYNRSLTGQAFDGISSEDLERFRNSEILAENQANAGVQTGVLLDDAIVKLKQGFDTFDMSLLDEAMELFGQMELDPDIRELVERAQDCIDNFDYEEGSNLFE